MKLALKPDKGWKYRVIVCDAQGRYKYDDFIRPVEVSVLIERMVKALKKEGGHGKKVENRCR